MEENSEKVVSAQKTLSSHHDPGWNDPPSWALSATSAPAGSTPTKRLLNKRVAFPLNSNSSPLSTSPIPNTPPMGATPPPVGISLTSAPHKPIVAPTTVKNEESLADLQVDKAQTLKDTLDNLRNVMDGLEKNRADEIQKRLDRMEAMWNEDKLNSVVHQKLLEISEALKEGCAERADQLHISLMMSHASVCSSWIPGVRQLITELKNKTV
ncbi:hypothetical protein QAD02_009076 [Eretmocerus hayati]|uniref:Uncharacterized protein n=1 Tax=Eretmocerus hayati TaxID=131215 RepID=A0ACC2N9J6_9HYME|nr:hypothetical protein QAD02_009076 [Eretmocerus hayati]